MDPYKVCFSFILHSILILKFQLFSFPFFPCRIAHQAPSILPSGPLILVPPSGTITPRSRLDQEVHIAFIQLYCIELN